MGEDVTKKLERQERWPWEVVKHECLGKQDCYNMVRVQ